MRAVILSVFVLVMAMPTWAVQPDEILDDPVLEQRARDLSKDLRCMVCRNESIDESHAGLARDMRLLVRERLVAGDTDDEVMDFIVARYGEYALLNPKKTGSNLILWIAGPVMLVLAVGVGVAYQRRNNLSDDTPTDDLSDEERQRLDQLLKDT
ncbi:MAG: cytochrome c-type biogenesis protein [Pseudomonadota bacterium]